MNESIADIKVANKKLCTKCEKELKVISLGGGDIFSSLTSRGGFYCENKECDHFGLLTVACVLHAEEKES